MTKVIYYTTTIEESPILNFIQSLSSIQKSKISRIISHVEEYGLIAVIPHVRKLTGTPLWEIRILGQDNIRVLYALTGKDIILLLHGFIKKSQQTPSREINTALKRLQEWVTRKEKS